MVLAKRAGMQHGVWTKPEFRELNLSAEIGSYYEHEDIPLFVTSARRSEGFAQAVPALLGKADGGRE